MNERLLEAIKGERRENLGKRFDRWIKLQWSYKRGSFKIWRVSEERAIKEITESIFSDPSKCYFVYEEDKLQSLSDCVDRNTLEVNILLFKEILRDCKLNELGI